MTRPRVLFYCQHSVGLGHLVRSLHLAQGLAEEFDVTLLNGGPWPSQLPRPSLVEVVDLPPMGLDGSRALVSRDERFTMEDALWLRRSMIMETYRDTDPDAVLVELFPFGRKHFAGGLLPLLEAARDARPSPFVACSLRDILVGSRRDQQRHDDRASEVANELFDAVLVHADARFATLDETFHPQVPLRIPVHYTGFVRGAQPLPSNRGGRTRERERRVLVSAGGGLVGAPLFRAAVAAHPRVSSELGLRTVIVTGPFLPEDAVHELTREAEATDGLEVVRYLPELREEMAASAVSVSQVGYNTTMDILGSSTPAVVVPYADGPEDEQAERARRLERLGALRVVDPTRLSGDALADAVRDALHWSPMPVPLDLDGRRCTAELLRDLVLARTAEPAS
jgi:predicted glycosyltransferase